MKISIVMAIYNAESFLKQCLDSIVNQTLKDYELIAVDDGSTDGSLGILKQYKQQYSQIHIFHHEHTGKGAAGARNMGMRYAKGKYLLFLDADDYFSEYLLEHTYEKAEQTHADIVMYDIEIFDGNTGNYLYYHHGINMRYLPEKEVFSGKDAKIHLYQINVSAAWAMLLRRKFVEENKLHFQELYGPDDQFFVFTALSVAQKITILDEKLLFYRKNTLNSQMANIHKCPLAITQVYIALQDWLKEKGLFGLYAHTYYECALLNFQWYIRHMDTYDAYSMLYNYLNSEGYEKIGMTREKLECSGVSQELVEWFLDVRMKSSEEYAWFYMKKNQNQAKYQYRYTYPMGLFRQWKRVILYGAGLVGQDFYMQNYVKKYCQIVAWVDKRAEECDFPVTGRQTIFELEYDIVLIAVASREIADTIRAELCGMGIETERIKWIAPIGDC